ncbi:MAG: hypothetical protein H0Z33_01200 [Bacillaceae bacterium]|nr:hypothetical protein [Bacillaceae bacterium]
MDKRKRDTGQVDWTVDEGNTSISEDGTVFNPVIERINLEDGTVTSLEDEWNLEK